MNDASLSPLTAPQAVRILDTIQSGVRVLQDNEKALLPLVHTLWAPLVARMQEKNEVVDQNSEAFC